MQNETITTKTPFNSKKNYTFNLPTNETSAEQLLWLWSDFRFRFPWLYYSYAELAEHGIESETWSFVSKFANACAIHPQNNI